MTDYSTLVLDSDENLYKFEAPEIIFGSGSLFRIGECAKRQGGERVLLVTDPGIIEAGWIDETLKRFEREDLRYVIFDNVSSNPRDFQVEQGTQLYRKKKCDVIVAVGGGSPIDAAKGIAILASNDGRIHDFQGCNLISQPIPPLICAPTTAGTGADVSQFAVIGDTKQKVKMTILSRSIMPDISLIDPRILQTLTPDLIAATGIDTLSHAIEAYVSSQSWALTDPYALHAVELVSKYLYRAVDSQDPFALEKMSIASLKAGLAFSNAILGAVHALAHPLGGIYDIHHGLANSLVLPAVVRRNLKYATKKYADIAKAMGIDSNIQNPESAAAQVPDRLCELIREIHLPTRLSQVGVQQEDIPMLARMAQNDICMLTNPHSYSIDEIEEIYHEVW